MPIMLGALIWCAWLAFQTAGGATAGTITVTGSPEQCSAAQSIQVWRRTSAPGTTPPEGIFTEQVAVESHLSGDGGLITNQLTMVAGQPVRGECRWTFTGFPVGEYVALLHRADGSGGAKTFRATRAPQTIALPAPLIALSGRVARNGEGISGLKVRVVELPFYRPAVVAFTDRAGRYRVVLDRPGKYEINIDAVGFVPMMVALTSGDNEIETGPR
jgi:hypothetical protein